MTPKNPPERQIMRAGIRKKAVLAMLGALLATLSVSGLLLYKSLESDIYNETDRRGNEMVSYLSRTLAYSMVGHDYHTIQLMLEEVLDASSVSHVRVYSMRGNLMAEVGEARDAGQSNARSFQSVVVLNEARVGHIELALDTSDIVAQLSEKKAAIIKREAVVIALIALLQYIILSYIIIRPLTSLSSELQGNIEEDGIILKPLPVKSNDEIGNLASSFNLLRGKLNDANGRLLNRVESADMELQNAYTKLLDQAAKLQAANEELERLSLSDPLTGLGNRRSFTNEVEKEIHSFRRHGDTGSLLVLDLDHFKSINDTYGHDIGDVVLMRFAELLKKRVRETDTICRMGGEEFAVFLKRTNQEMALKTAESLREMVANMEIELNALDTIRVTVSIGVSTLSEAKGVTAMEALCKSADIALYQSKNNGRNRVTHYGLSTDGDMKSFSV